MQPTQYAIRYTIYDIRYTSYPNRRNAPNSAATPNKPPVQPSLSTNYDLIMQNKANFPDDPMNVNKVLKKDYENVPLRRRVENKPNTKPNKANLLNAQMNVNNVNKVLTKDYENTSNWALGQNKANTKPNKPNLKILAGKNSPRRLTKDESEVTIPGPIKDIG